MLCKEICILRKNRYLLVLVWGAGDFEVLKKSGSIYQAQGSIIVDGVKNKVR